MAWDFPQYLGGGGEPSEASVDLSADVSGAAGGQRASLRLREGPLAYLPGEAILVFVGSVTLVYPQATDNDSEGDPKRKNHCLPEELNWYLCLSKSSSFSHSELVGGGGGERGRSGKLVPYS